MSDLKVRTITAAVLTIIILPIAFFGGIVIDIFLGLLTIGAAYELEKMFKKENKWGFYNIASIVLSLLVYVSLVVIFSIQTYDTFKYILMVISSVFLIEGFMMIFVKSSTVETLGNSLITAFYPSIGFASMALIRNFNTDLYRDGLFILLFGIIVCIMTDMFAYFFGKAFGKHKLSPISPKKSWEGSIAGTVFAVVFGTLFSMLTGVSKFIFGDINVFLLILFTALLSLVLSIIDEIGDLFASKLKRYYGIKDYSNIFPGHGGILDRFDSYIFVSVAIFAYLLILI